MVWFLARLAFILVAVAVLFLSQRFWYRAAWRLTARVGNPAVRAVLRGLWLVALAVVLLAALDAVRLGRPHLIPRGAFLPAIVGLWFSSALFAYVAVKLVAAFEWLWTRFRQRAPARAASPSGAPPDPSRRYFFQSASYFAGAVPFVGALYGFAAERLHFQVHQVELPVAQLPPALDGFRIAQLSDIHLSGYMTRGQVRRAVSMANDLAPHLAVVTGDFITAAGDPLPDCIAELARLRAPLGVWGCNGNHEIYARAEEEAHKLFARHDMRILRHENVPLAWRGAHFNLMGVDYQRERTPAGRSLPMLPRLEPLVRRDIPNILLSHNPNSFLRAAELGIELTLSGHTHGGQVQVEILDHRFSPARFFTDFIAGLYRRPLFAPSALEPHSPSSASFSARPLAPSEIEGPRTTMRESPLAAPAPLSFAALYVNRGLGTVGAPVRLGVPPEITLLTLRRA